MKPVTPELLTQLAIDALERTAFVLAEEAESCDSIAENGTSVGVKYTGPSSGCLAIHADGEFVTELVSSMLGIEPSEVVLGREGVDALKELANIVAGSLLRELGAEHEYYRLGLPDICNTQIVPDAACCLLSSEGGLIQISWCDTIANTDEVAA